MADIRIIPNRTSGDPYVVLSPSGTATSGINLYVLTTATGLLDTGVATLSFEGSQGQLFSVTDQLQSGVIFSVNDIGGLPLIEADASGYVYLARYGESVGVGQYINSGVRLLVSPGLTSRVGLAITGVAGQTADLFQVRDASGNALFGISPSGKIGIGTGSPASNIHLVDNYPQVRLDRTGVSSYSEIQFAIQNNIKAYIWHEYDTGNNIDDIAIGDGYGNTAFRVARSGSVSVSAGVPGYHYPIAQYRLAVNGFGTTTGTYSATFNDNNGTSLLAVRDDGNIGIGTLTPNSKLEINTVSSTKKGLVVKGAAAQSANLLEVQNSAGTNLLALDNLGAIRSASIWNSSGTAFTGLLMNVTDSGSNDSSNLMNLQVNGVDRFKVRKDGVLLPSGISLSYYGKFLTCQEDERGTIRFTSARDLAFGFQQQYCHLFDIDTGGYVGVEYIGLRGSSLYLADNSVASNIAAGDVYIFRDSGNILAQRNGMNPQTFRLYNNYIDNTGNYERAKFAWQSGVLQIGTEKGSVSGSVRALELQTDNNTRLAIATDGNSTFSQRVMIDKAPSGTSIGNPLLLIGGPSYTTTNQFYTIGFGYTANFTSRPPVEIGFDETSSTANTKGDFIVATRDVTTNTAATTRFRITSSGNVGINNDSPLYMLDVSGIGNFSSGVRYPDGVVQTIAYTGQSSTGTFVVTGTYTAGSGLTLNGYEFSTFGTGNFTGGIRYPDGIIQTVAYTGQGSGGSSYLAGSGLILNGTTFNLSGTGQLTALLFDNDHVRIGNVSDYTGYQANQTSIHIGRNAGSGGIKSHLSDYNNIYIGERAGASITGGNGNAVYIGTQAGRNSYLGAEICAIGTTTMRFSSSCTSVNAIGVGAGSESSGLVTTNLIGYQSAYRAKFSWYSEYIGYQAGYEANNSQYTVAIGTYAAYKNTGVYENIYVGIAAGAHISASTGTVAIGKYAGSVRSGNDNISIGTFANSTSQVYAANPAYQIFINKESIAIGPYASYESPETSYNLSIGRYANAYSSGIHNVFLGSYAGYGTTGNNNLEIVSSGLSTSIIGNTSNKLNINYSIIGDTSSKKFAIGDVGSGNLNPNATLELITKVSTDKAFIVKAATSQSANLTEWQNNLGSILLRVDNSGNISGNVNVNFNNATMNTGTLNAIYLSNNTPSNTTDALYNSNGTLYFNGTAVASGSGPSGGVTVETSIINALIFG